MVLLQGQDPLRYKKMLPDPTGWPGITSLESRVWFLTQALAVRSISPYFDRKLITL